MFKTILVEDEELAFNKLKKLLNDDGRINLIGSFLRSDYAIEFSKENKIDVAFLDIEMPGINGLKLATKLQKLHRDIHIIFVTAYDTYTLEALNIHVFGYLLKPYSKKELKCQIDSLEKKFIMPKNDEVEVLKITCFGEFTCSTKDGQKIKFKTSKSEELFALLIDSAGKSISKDTIIDILWQDIDFEKSSNLFRVTCTYLRQALNEYGFSNILIRELDKYRINTSLVDCDYINFKKYAKIIDDEHVNDLISASRYYTGNYLGNMPYEWNTSSSVWINNKIIEIGIYIANYLINNGKSNKACIELQKLLTHIPDEETCLELLIKTYIDEGKKASALNVYNDYKEYLKLEYDEEPSDSIKNYFL